jgi:hypothetical protein
MSRSALAVASASSAKADEEVRLARDDLAKRKLLAELALDFDPATFQPYSKFLSEPLQQFDDLRFRRRRSPVDRASPAHQRPQSPIGLANIGINWIFPSRRPIKPSEACDR